MNTLQLPDLYKFNEFSHWRRAALRRNIALSLLEKSGVFTKLSTARAGRLPANDVENLSA